MEREIQIKKKKTNRIDQTRSDKINSRKKTTNKKRRSEKKKHTNNINNNRIEDIFNNIVVTHVKTSITID